MPELKLRLKNDLGVNPETNALAFKKSDLSGNTLTFKPNGLYAEAIDGEDGSDGSGYIGPSETPGMRVGYKTPYGNILSPRTVLMTNVIHRVYTSNNGNGTDLQNYRRDIDYILPGDFFMYNGKPCLVTTVTLYGNDGQISSPGNTVATFVQLIP